MYSSSSHSRVTRVNHGNLFVLIAEPLYSYLELNDLSVFSACCIFSYTALLDKFLEAQSKSFNNHGR